MVVWADVKDNTERRPKLASKAIGHADLTASAVSQAIAFAAELPDNAIVQASWGNVTEAFASVGSASAASKTSGNSETYSMTDGQTVLLNADTLGEETATFNFAAGTQEDNTYYPVADQVGLKINVTVDGGSAQEVEFTTPCTTAAHVRAQIAAQTTGLAVSEGVTALAAFIPTNTADATFNLIVNGDTAVIDVDDAGPDTATWGIGRATSSGAAATYTAMSGKTLLITIDGGSEQTITFTAGATDAASTNEEINAQLVGGFCVVNGTETDISSDVWGTNSHVIIGAGSTAIAEAGHAAADNARASDDAADGTVVTIAEVKTFLEGAITSSSGLTIADIGGNRFSMTSNTTGTDSELDVQSGTLLAKLGITVDIVIGTASQALLTSDTLGSGSTILMVDIDSDLTFAAANDGSGDAIISTAVTAAEVVAVYDTDFSNSTHTIDGGAPVIQSDTTGTGSTLNFGAGTANTVLGLDDETITGVDAVNGTATFDMGMDGGDVDAIIDDGNITAATGIINGPKGVASDGNYGGETPNITVRSNVNVEDLTAGAMIAYIQYISMDLDI